MARGNSCVREFCDKGKLSVQEYNVNYEINVLRYLVALYMCKMFKIANFYIFTKENM